MSIRQSSWETLPCVVIDGGRINYRKRDCGKFDAIRGSRGFVKPVIQRNGEKVSRSSHNRKITRSSRVSATILASTQVVMGLIL